MPKFRKKPVEIEARQFLGENGPDLAIWMGDNATTCEFVVSYEEDCTFLLIHTLEGKMRADKYDWIIQGVAGEFYPCKPDIFEATYDQTVADYLAGLHARAKEHGVQ